MYPARLSVVQASTAKQMCVQALFARRTDAVISVEYVPSSSSSGGPAVPSTNLKRFILSKYNLMLNAQAL